jgi:hypothetical protein
MLYAGSNDELRKSLDGIAVEVQATDSDEVEYKSKHTIDLIYPTLFFIIIAAVLAKAKQGTR